MHSDKEDEVEEEVGSSPEVRFSSLFQGFTDCGDRAMNDFLPALSLRAILYYLNTWNNLVSRVLSYSAPAEREKILATRLRLEQATITGKSR